MGFFSDVDKTSWEHVSRVMNFLTTDALALILSTPFRVILRSYKYKDWVNVIFSYSYDNLSSVSRNSEFDILFRVNLSYWEKPYCSFPWPFYISLFAVNWVNLRFSSGVGYTFHYPRITKNRAIFGGKDPVLWLKSYFVPWYLRIAYSCNQ